MTSGLHAGYIATRILHQALSKGGNNILIFTARKKLLDKGGGVYTQVHLQLVPG